MSGSSGAKVSSGLKDSDAYARSLGFSDSLHCECRKLDVYGVFGVVKSA